MKYKPRPKTMDECFEAYKYCQAEGCPNLAHETVCPNGLGPGHPPFYAGLCVTHGREATAAGMDSRKAHGDPRPPLHYAWTGHPTNPETGMPKPGDTPIENIPWHALCSRFEAVGWTPVAVDIRWFMVPPDGTDPIIYAEESVEDRRSALAILSALEPA